MHTSHLRKHILTNDRLVGSDSNAAETLHHARDVVQLTFHNVRLCVELVLQDGLYGGQWCIATTLP